MERERHWVPTWRAVILVPLWACVAGATLFGALEIACRLAQTSDSAQSFVAGQAILRGNLLLAGWHVPLDDYYFTDTIAYAAWKWLAGPLPLLLALVPALTYTLFVCVVLIVCLKLREPLTRNIEAAAAVALMLAAPAWAGSWNPLLMSDMHFATVLGALVALSLCASVVESEQKDAWVIAGLGAALTVVTATTVASDPFSLVFAFGPALAMLSARALRQSRAPGARLVLLLLASGTALGMLLPLVIARAGGFTTEDNVVTGFVAWSLLGRNLIALGASVLTLFGANPSGMDFSPRATLLFVLHGTALAIAILAVARAVRGLFARVRASLFEQLICAGILSVLAACALSTQFGKGITPESLWMGGPPMRYAMPAVLFAAVLGARRIPEMIAALRGPRTHKFARGTLIVCALLGLLVGGLNTVESAPLWVFNNPPALAARWLGQQGLKEGAGEYWSANLVSAMSGDAVRIGSFVPLEGKIVPYVLAADRNWFAQTPQFVIWQDNNKTGMNFAQVRATFPVCRVALVAGYRIAVIADRRHGSGCARRAAMTRPIAG